MSFSKTYVGYNAKTPLISDKRPVITGVRLILTDDTSILVGTEDNVLEAELPLCNSTETARAYAQSILSSLSGWQYQPYSIEDMILDPAVQLGDGLTFSGLYGTLYKSTFSLGPHSSVNASAPWEEEIDHEYPFESGKDRKEKRKYQDLKDDVAAEFTVQAGQISAVVTSISEIDGEIETINTSITEQSGLISAKVSKQSPSGQTSFSWDMNDTSHVWYSNGNEVFRLDSTGAHVTGEITATSGTIGGCAIQNGVLKVGTANVTQLSIGSNFSVDTAGNMIANNATITGTLSVGGNLISASDLWTGAANAAVSHTTWSGTSSTVTASAGGWNSAFDQAVGNLDSYMNSKVYGTGNYPSYFTCGQLNHKNAYMTFNGHILQILQAAIGTRTIYYLGYT